MSHTFNKSPFTFNAPSKFNPTKFAPDKFQNKDILFNKKKISSDAISMSSASVSSSAASSKSETNSSSSSERKPQQYEEYEEESEQSQEESAVEEEEDTFSYENAKKDRKQMILNEINEKREILYQMDRLESKGYKLPFKFNMESDLQEMKSEYTKLIREKDIDASIRFQRKMMMAFVTGTEYLNTRYDPFAIRLEGWSEQIHENITDYDDIFEELHVKYKSTGKKMSPELRLFISLSGSAFMFHLTSRMFKENPLPNVENVLKSNPDLMKQFQMAAAKQYIAGTPAPANANQDHMSSANGGLFGMVSNLFNNLGGGSSRPPRRDDDEVSNTSIRRYKQQKDIDNIINNVHSKISFDPNQNNIETLSVSDEELTSIIEDTADIKILSGGKNKKNQRTLNL